MAAVSREVVPAGGQAELMQPAEFDVLIVGGGLAGLSLACALRDARLRLALVEQFPPRPVSGWDARVYAISPANVDLLSDIGVWRHLPAERMAPIRAMEVYGDGGARLDFSAYETGIDELGWILESSLIAGELWENVKRQSNLTLFCPGSPASLSAGPDAAVLTLADRTLLRARLLVGADGRDSWVREALGLRAFESDYHEKGVVANFACQRAHRGIARQWFRDDGVLAWLPLPGDRISIVWSTSTEKAEEMLGLTPDQLCAKVAAAGHGALGGLTLLTPPAAFPLRLMLVPRIIGPRLALLGDAAHAIHPLSGHGINLGLQDARSLAGLLTRVPEWQDVGAERLLQRYQRQRREETLLLQCVTHALHDLFASRWPGLRTLRNLGMRLTDQVPVVKNLLVRYATGIV